MAGPLDAQRRQVMDRAPPKLRKTDAAKLLLAGTVALGEAVERPFGGKLTANLGPNAPKPVTHMPWLRDPPSLAMDQLDPMMDQLGVVTRGNFGTHAGDRPPERVRITPHTDGGRRRHDGPHMDRFLIPNPRKPPTHIGLGMKGIEHPGRRKTRHPRTTLSPSAIEQDLSEPTMAHHDETSSRVQTNSPKRLRGIGEPEAFDAVDAQFRAVITREHPTSGVAPVDRGFLEAEMNLTHAIAESLTLPRRASGRLEASESGAVRRAQPGRSCHHQSPCTPRCPRSAREP